MGGNCKEQESSGEREEKEEKFEKIFYIIAIISFVLTFIPQILGSIKIALYIATILMAGYEIFIKGIKNLIKLNFEEDTLMTIAVVAACILGEFIEACLIVLLFKLGEFIEEKAIDKSNKSIHKIVDIKAKNANLIDGENIKTIDVNDLKIDDYILIKPGDMVPVDCKIISGSSELDTSNITGESTPVTVKKDMELLSGSINLSGSLKCIVTKVFKDSTASQIVDLVYEAQNNKGKTEEFITKFSKIYTPIVIILAVLITVIPILIGLDLKTWIMRALVFLVAACPCSIVISIPLALYTCLGEISKKGMLIKGTKHIEDLAKADIIAFDKTGTLTTGKMSIDKLTTYNSYDEEEVLEYMYLLEKNSSHPIASAIAKRVEELGLKDKISKHDVVDYKEIAGCGICGNIDGKMLLFGNKKLLEKYSIKHKNNIDEKMNYLILNDEIISAISLKEEIRSKADKLSYDLKKVGIKKIVILTGDNKENANKIAKDLNITEVHAGLLPKEKLEEVEKLKKSGKTIFVGDGINDSPVLATADFSISMGEGTEIAGDTADSILISNNLNSIADSIKISKKTISILKFNIIFSLIIKAFVLTLGIIGSSPIWIAVFADVGVTLLTVLNSIRIK